MFSQRIHTIISKIAIFLVMFASLAPTVSHALAAQSNSSFLQEICSSNGTKKIIIQTYTTKGQQMATVLNSKNPVPNNQETAAHHFEHCPFCSAGAANIAIAPAPAWILMLAEQAKAIDADYVTPVQPSFTQTAHPTRAPPVL